MRNIISLFFLLGFVASNAFAYADMTQQATNAASLNMTLNDYTLTMAISGALMGFSFGLFLWKAR